MMIRKSTLTLEWDPLNENDVALMREILAKLRAESMRVDVTTVTDKRYRPFGEMLAEVQSDPPKEVS